jgi:hypothetical protein
MTPQSAKGKGRRLQQWVRDKLLERFPTLEPDDVRSTSMGAGGEDVLLSPAARRLFPFSVECKNLAAIATYKFYAQAKANCPKGTEPLVIMKQNHSRPLAVVDAEWFINHMQKG